MYVSLYDLYLLLQTDMQRVMIHNLSYIYCGAENNKKLMELGINILASMGISSMGAT